MKPQLESLATMLGRPADQLQELDYRPLALAFVPSSFVTYLVQDRSSGEILEVTLNIDTGQTADPEALRQLDQKQGAIVGGKLSPELLALVLRHAGLEAVQVCVSFSPDTTQAAGWRVANIDEGLRAQLAANLQQLGIELPLQKSERELEIELVLSVQQIVSLGASPLVQSIELVGEPEVPDQAE